MAMNNSKHSSDDVFVDICSHSLNIRWGLFGDLATGDGIFACAEAAVAGAGAVAVVVAVVAVAVVVLVAVVAVAAVVVVAVADVASAAVAASWFRF